MGEKNLGGRPPTYKNVEEIKEKIEEYFKWCEGEPLIVDGEVVLNKAGEPVIYNKHPLTITGLALALGFTTRQALLNYEAKAEFVDTIKEAKSRVERYAEERLYDRDGVNGAKFSLSNNFKGWAEKQQIEADVKNDVNICIELSDDE